MGLFAILAFLVFFAGAGLAAIWNLWDRFKGSKD